MLRRTLIASPLLLAAGRAAAADWTPRQPIHLLVGFAPGGGVDYAARLMAADMQQDLGIPVNVLTGQQFRARVDEDYKLLTDVKTRAKMSVE